MGFARTLLASSSSHKKALDTFFGQKAHPSILSPPCRGALEGSQTWMEISDRGEGEVLRPQALFLQVQSG